MIEQATRKRVLAAGAVTVAAAGASHLLFLGTGMFFFLPATLVGLLFGTNAAASLLLPLVAAPLLGVAFWRRPWWARWACLGYLLYNLAMLVYIERTAPPGPGIFG